MNWLIKHKNKKLFWSAEYKNFNLKSEQCESYFLEEDKMKIILPTDGIWVKAADFGMTY